MKKNSISLSIIFFCFFIQFISGTSSVYAQRTGFPDEEFTGRRDVLMERVKTGMIFLFANSALHSGSHFRQDNDFYYFTGREDMYALLILIPETRKTIMFLPRQTPREEMVEGKNLLGDEEAKKRTGISEFYSLDFLNEYLARKSEEARGIFYLRLSGQDTVDSARGESLLFHARSGRNPYNDQITLDAHRVKKLRERFPGVEIKDITPFIDEMRVIKSPREIEIMRRNGKISAEAVKAAMIASAPGVYEYEVEAAAIHVILKNGALGAAFPPIIGSGPNSCVWHYEKNERMMEAGEVVLMDFGADLNYLCMDISRTWPVSGTFTPEQKEVYRAVLEVQKASIEAYRPGATLEDVKKHVAKVMAQKKIDTRGLSGVIHHYVGMATHDVGIGHVPLKEGMVFTVEPGLYYPEKALGIRIEDTVLITRDGCEVLTRDVPKEIEEIEALLANKGKK